MKYIITAAAALLLVGLASARVGEEIPRAVLSGGGGSTSAVVHSIGGTLGQPAVGVSTGGTHSLRHGFWIPRVSVTAVDDEPAALRFALHQNVPNPFNPSTEIRFDLPEAQDRLEIRIFDVSGRMVRTLRGTGLSAGSHSITWNGRDEAGHPVASGVYYYTLEIPQTRATHKMTLVR